MVEEGGGKRRIFAIGNNRNPRLLRPYHDWLMAVLRRIPCDGTFNQEGPLAQLKGFNDVYSFDLKSATDRWPLTLLMAVMSFFFGPSLAGAVVQSTLGYNTFSVLPPAVKRPSAVCFVTGQPLEYYSSWPLFTLTHHIAVWMAAERVSPDCRFRAYAILGDDVVIASSRVASEYLKVLDDLGVKISYQKSLISETGAFEFAKRFFVHQGSVDLSPISIRALF